MSRRVRTCPNCGEEVYHCGCKRNKCKDCGQPVGNITFTVCDKCWDKMIEDKRKKDKEKRPVKRK